MSLNSAMISGVSSLIANSTALAAISDNISNVDTVGYKQNDTQFQDLVSTSLSSAPTGTYNSGGVQADVAQLISQQGQFQQTTTATNMAINGAGLFVVAGTSAGITSTDGASYTRAGNFTTDSQGYLVNSAGYYLQGWVASSSGAITPNPSQSSLASINIDSIANAPNPSTTAALSANLNADAYPAGEASAAATAAANAGAGAYDPTSTSTSMAAYDASGGTTGTQPDFSTQMTVYDSQGGAHTVQLDFLKAATPDTWDVEINVVPATDVTTTGPTGTGQIAAGTVTFNSDGSFNSTSLNTTATPSTAAAGQIALSIPWAADTGLSAQTVNLNLNSTTGGLTQYASASVQNSDTVNGGPTSPVSGVTITSDGYVQATFGNGTTENIAQVAVATFNNPDGLTAVSGDAYRASQASGSYTLSTPQEGSAGSIEAAELESSTVDLSTEFTNLITTQNAYSAGSKIIATADQMMQTLEAVIQG